MEVNMHRLARAASIAALSGFLAIGLAHAEAPLLNADCVDDISLCTGDGGGLEPGQVRVRPVSAIDGPDDGPLLLTNRDLGLSTEELADKSAPAEVVEMAAVKDTAEAPVEPAAEAPTSGETHPEAAEPPVGQAEAPAPVPTASEFTADESGIAQIDERLDFSGCMERSIRAGNEFAESQRVCAAVFPE
jgi:hypothetical protein